MTSFELEYTVDLVADMYKTHNPLKIQTLIKQLFNQDVTTRCILSILNIPPSNVGISLKSLFT